MSPLDSKLSCENKESIEINGGGASPGDRRLASPQKVGVDRSSLDDVYNLIESDGAISG